MNKRVVVTGGTSRFGKDVVKRFVEAGNHVLFTGIEHRDDGEAVADELKAINDAVTIEYCRCNLSSEQSVKETAGAVAERLGGCDILVNNAANLKCGAVHQMEVFAWERVFDVDVKGVFLTCKHILPMMMEQHGGAVVNITSDADGLTGGSTAVSTSANGAVLNLTQSMALDYADYGIRVNAVSPMALASKLFARGAAPSDLVNYAKSVPLKRIAKPVEVANAVFFLASDQASFITGVNLPVDGGLSASRGPINLTGPS
ncbi:SDR family NAD(P)-dependent oxidoreductase [Pseudovibrio exalbescens]|uniref:SDR family NAD(P)-dependent oxidoreductase n=1 Tax=Pseudovibrio exalbescens TaxID=197461 RepID=UPI002365E18B|nr:SDR family oxidoreductase [Pseudovibrio exalbescens]MDD7909080.1 SDR family NAD(P)-dependent oxidoreductase [Pseudovibrio exalbescens]